MEGIKNEGLDNPVDTNRNEARPIGALISDIMDGIARATPDAVHPRVGNLNKRRDRSPAKEAPVSVVGGRRGFHAAALAISAGKGLPMDSATILICAKRERGMPILRQL